MHSHEAVFPLTFIQSVFDQAAEFPEEELLRGLGCAARPFGLPVFFTQRLRTQITSKRTETKARLVPNEPHGHHEVHVYEMHCYKALTFFSLLEGPNGFAALITSKQSLSMVALSLGYGPKTHTPTHLSRSTRSKKSML